MPEIKRRRQSDPALRVYLDLSHMGCVTIGARSDAGILKIHRYICVNRPAACEATPAITLIAARSRTSRLL